MFKNGLPDYSKKKKKQFGRIGKKAKSIFLCNAHLSRKHTCMKVTPPVPHVTGLDSILYANTVCVLRRRIGGEAIYCDNENFELARL